MIAANVQNQIATTALTTGNTVSCTSLLKTTISGVSCKSVGSALGIGVSATTLGTVLCLLAGSATVGFLGYRFIKSTIRKQ